MMITRIHSLNRRCEIMHACMLSQFVFLEPLFLPVKTAEARRLETADCDTVSALFLESTDTMAKTLRGNLSVSLHESHDHLASRLRRDPPYRAAQYCLTYRQQRAACIQGRESFRQVRQMQEVGFHTVDHCRTSVRRHFLD